MVNSSGRTASESALPVGLATGAADEVEEATGVSTGAALVTAAEEDAAGVLIGAATEEAAAEEEITALEEAAGVSAAATDELAAALEEVAAGAAEETTLDIVVGTGFSGAAPAAPPPTLVVSSPSSMYTPLKNQSSAPSLSAWPGSLRTPRCQSLPSEEVLASKGPAVCFNSSLPVECQKATEPASKSIS